MTKTTRLHIIVYGLLLVLALCEALLLYMIANMDIL
jgi:hypothetical protein